MGTHGTVGGRHLSMLIAGCALCVLASVIARGADTPARSENVHDAITSSYLDGKWEQLDSQFATIPAASKSLTPNQLADVSYVRKTVAECRPAWWKLCKAGKKVSFRASVWGTSQGFTYDPAQKTNMQLNFVNGTPAVTLMWDASQMDSDAPAEHGFTKGELNDLLVWQLIGMSSSMSSVPVHSMLNLNADAQLLLNRYLDFRGNIAGLYYSTPRARRWALWLDLAVWNPEYSKVPTVTSRKACGAMFMQEVVGNRAKYPSIELPASLPQGGAEEKLAEHLRHWIEKHPMTLSEDESLRDAIKTFAAANALNVRTSGTVKLPSGLLVALDPDHDKAEAAKRDAWLVSHLSSQSK